MSGPDEPKRQNPYAGRREAELRAAFGVDADGVKQARQAWKDGHDDLAELDRKLRQQQAGLAKYGGKAGNAAAEVFKNMLTMIGKRRQEMDEVSTALFDSHGAVATARTAHDSLPRVRPPSDGKIPAALPMGATKKQKEKHTESVEQARRDNASADADHESDKRAAEAEATRALATLNLALNDAADRMRPVAGMEKPGPMQTATQNRQPAPGPAGPRGGTTGPGDTSAPGPDRGTVLPDRMGPEINPDTDITPPDITPPDELPDRDPDMAPENLPEGPGPFPDRGDGVLLGPGVGATPGPGGPVGIGTPGGAGTSSVGTPGTVPIGAGGIPGSGRPVPGSSARTSGRTPIGSSRTTASRGVLGRSGLTPGQAMGAGSRGATGGRAVPGQSATGRGGRAGAGSRGAGAAGGRGVPGQSAGRGGRRGKGERDDDYRSTYLQDESQWLDDDETSPPTLD